MRFIALVVIAAFATIYPMPARSAVAGFATYQPATVDPPVSRPDTKHCTVTLLHNVGFSGFGPRLSQFAPPADCPAPWSKVVLDFDTRVKGVQYDRIGNLWIGRDEVFRFSTAEPTHHGIAYHVEKDVSRYIPLLRSPQPVTAELGNVVNATYTGVFFVTATLTFYETGPHDPPARTADVIVPVDNEMTLEPVDSSGKLSITYPTLPRNIVRATLDLYASNHGCDEFWYTNLPDAYVAKHRKLGFCGGGPYREIDVWVDHRLANVVYPFPYIWTGGINPMLWRPLSALHTLDVPSYQVDLNPWAGVLANAGPHTIAVTVYNDRGSWPIDGNLLLSTDPRRTVTGGAVTRDTIAPHVVERSRARLTARGGAYSVKAARRWSVSGYVDTSGGRVTYTLDDRMTFSNAQTLNNDSGAQNADALTTFATVTTRRDPSGTKTAREVVSYPLTADSVYPPPNKTKPYTLVIEATVHQGYHARSSHGRCDATVDATATLKRIRPHVDAIAQGRTTERNACSGAARRFDIRKSAVNGKLLTPVDGKG